MELLELRLSNVRNVEAAEIAFRSGASEFIGANGAGKTSVLEAVYMLSHGRSFRSTKRESLIRFGQPSLEVFAEVKRAGRIHRLGLSRQRGDWTARLDGAEVGALSDLLREIAVVCFEPGSHALISGPSDERRHFMDWALFHVEPGFTEVARRYRRAVKQRNALLRGTASNEELDVWDVELARAATVLDEWRSAYLFELTEVSRTLSAAFLPELGTMKLSYERGWNSDVGLSDALRQRRERDRERGHTTVGPHRGDWRIAFDAAPEREHLSRGQEKLTALICLLAQAQLFFNQIGEWPILCLDDLASELDAEHQRRVLRWLDEVEAQVLITGTVALPALDLTHRQRTMFHVEQGAVTTLL